MTDRPAALLTVAGTANAAPSLEQAAHALRLAIESLDATFGVVPIDPAQQLYCVRVYADAADFTASTKTTDAYADVKIAAFGDGPDQLDESSFKVP